MKMKADCRRLQMDLLNLIDQEEKQTSKSLLINVQ